MTDRVVALVVDGAVSDDVTWPQVASIVAAVIEQLAELSVEGIYLLGTDVRWEPSQWQTEMPLPAAARDSWRFLAPVVACWRVRRLRPHAALLIATGTVFDLDDWHDAAGQWFRVLVAGLTPFAGGVTEISTQQLGIVPALLARTQDVPSRPTPVGLSGIQSHRWALDRTGYPLVWIDPLGAFVHLFPLTKSQYEQYLVLARPDGRGAVWYSDLLKLNSRLSAAATDISRYEQLLVTGLLPRDVADLAIWLASDATCLTVDAWRVTWRWLSTQPVSVPSQEIERCMAPMARLLWRRLFDTLRPSTLLDLSLMRDGVVEWVCSAAQSDWCGMGQPRVTFYESLHDGLLSPPLTPTSLSNRSRLFGARLMRPT